MPISYDYRTADGEPEYPQPPYLPSIGLMPSQFSNLQTALGYPPNNVQVKSRYYTSHEIAQLDPDHVLDDDYNDVRSLVSHGISYEEGNPGGLSRIARTAIGLAGVGAVSVLMIFMGMI
jgi:hypothetical protein